MADEVVQKLEFHVRNLSTRCVTLYPFRAQVIRDITDITLKPGSNEITIYGLTPTADENSIKVDGRGSATITDMTVDQVPNPDIFEDVYPSDSEEDLDSSELEDEDEDSEAESVKTAKKRIAEHCTSFKVKNEAVTASHSAANLLDSLMARIEKPKLDDIAVSVDVYATQRKKIYEDKRRANEDMAELEKTIDKLEKECSKLERSAAKGARKSEKKKLKALEKRNRTKREKRLAKQRLRSERINFWPKKVYRVVLTLELTGTTPASSRRGSVDSLVKVASPSTAKGSEISGDPYQVSLCLSYVTNAASWFPRYDLSISSMSNSGTIVYRAELLNTTSETWRDAKVILSTSQTTFLGMSDPIPEMRQWNIWLQKGRSGHSSATLSKQETEYSRVRYDNHGGSWNDSMRANLFGITESNSASWSVSKKRPKAEMQSAKRGESLARTQHPERPHVPQRQGLPFPTSTFSAPSGSAIVGAAAQQQCATPWRDGKVGPVQEEDLIDYSDEEAPYEHNLCARDARVPTGYDPTIEDNDLTAVAQTSSLQFQESSWEETGLTTTYDVPGLRTIPFSFTPRRHKIATIALPTLSLTHICVPKLRPAAFLKAHITNASSITLLAGTAGLSLDGSFLGTTILPRCSAGAAFVLPLGVDPAVTVAYTRPTVRRNVTSGVFSKEGSVVFARSVTLTNTKAAAAAAPVEVLVRDQVPVSEDERLRVEVLAPKGLRVEGDVVRTGVETEPMEKGAAAAAAAAAAGGKGALAGQEGAGTKAELRSGTDRGVRGSVYGLDGTKGAQGREEKWGKATAKFGKGGEVEWTVKLNPGKGVRLVLEYEARFPASDSLHGDC